MPARLSLRLFALLLGISALCAPCVAHGQVFNLEQDRVQMAELKGLWRFHTGDDPRWSDPNFDDSSWPLLQSDEPWSVQGYTNYSGMAWYRFEVDVPPQHGPLALAIPNLKTNYQVFANGQLIGRLGNMPPHASPYSGPGQIIRIPGDALSSNSRIEIAVRVWHWPDWAASVGGGPLAPVRFGAAGEIEHWETIRQTEGYRFAAPVGVQILIGMLGAMAAFAFFVLNSGEREYLWFAIYQFFTVVALAIVVHRFFGNFAIQTSYLAENVAEVLQEVVFVVFLNSFLRHRSKRLSTTAIAFVVCAFATNVLGHFLKISIALGDWLLCAYQLGYMVAVLALILRNTAAKLERAWLFAAVALANFGIVVELAANAYKNAAHPKFIDSFLARFYHLSSWPFPFGVNDVLGTVMQLSILFLLVLRFARMHREEQQLASEVEAARLVQQVVIPEQVPTIPGYQIESVYKPMGEVGGDFFQIIPLKSGSALVAIGDVSGKGVAAAMTVSLLVGTLRTLSYFSQSPALILGAMNDSIAGRSTGGFTTCLVARIDPNGTVTMANAGHLAPYLGDREIALDAGLPLGLVPKSSYTELAFSLSERQQITFLTDGVVEARSKSGELFGFERTAFVVSKSARDIANAASQFGQDDDITVVTLRRLPESASGKTQAFTFPFLPATS